MKVETDPPVACPILRRAENYPPRLGFPQDLPKSLRSLKIVIECWTTLEDIKAAWPRVERLQKALPGYRERMRGHKDLDRDILLHWLVYVQGYTVGKTIEFLNEHSPEEDFYPDEATLGKSLRELDEQMKPTP